MKNRFLSVYNQLKYDYQSIILNTFKHLVEYKAVPEKGLKIFDVVGVIEKYQKEKGYIDQEVCDRVNSLIVTNNPELHLDINTYRKIKQRNSQSSKSNTNWLSLIAQALEFDESLYHKHFTKKGKIHLNNFATQHSMHIYSIETLYDLLSEKERNAIFELATLLLKLQITTSNEIEFLDGEYKTIE